jgi:hypothetical protein
MLGREYIQWNGDEDTAQGDELIPAASRADAAFSFLSVMAD